jgi:hypothetical protein
MPDIIEHVPVQAPAASSAADPSPPQDKGQLGLQKKDFEELNERLLAMPRDVGWLMVSIGVIGVALPGIVGTPALLAGGLMLWPKGFRAVNSWVRRRFPKTHEHGVEQLIRYLDDMEHRYPTQGKR